MKEKITKTEVKMFWDLVEKYYETLGVSRTEEEEKAHDELYKEVEKEKEKLNRKVGFSEDSNLIRETTIQMIFTNNFSELKNDFTYLDLCNSIRSFGFKVSDSVEDRARQYANDIYPLDCERLLKVNSNEEKVDILFTYEDIKCLICEEITRSEEIINYIIDELQTEEDVEEDHTPDEDSSTLRER